MIPITRRDFIHTMTAAAAVASTAGAAGTLRAAAPLHASARNKMIAIQLGAVSFIDEGIDPVLDILQERAGVNALMPAVYSFSDGTAGRHHPNPGHGKDDNGTKLVGGNFATVHPAFYKDVGIDPLATQAPDHPGFDVLRELIPPARKRGMKVIGLFQNSLNERMPGAEKLLEVDFNGQRADTLCFNNPYHRNFMAGLVADYIKSYEVDGLIYVNETQGALSNMIGARFRGRERGLPGSRTCFCEHCLQKAKAQGIQIERVKKGFQEAEKFVAAGRAHRRPVDGFYVSFWRLILRYPELLQWEHFFHESSREFYRMLRDQVKAARNDALFGLHIWTNASMSPIYRAEQDYQELSGCADFLKIALYNNCGGPRMDSYIQSIGDTLYGDLSHEEVAQFHYRVLGYNNEAPYGKMTSAGPSAGYVGAEVKRAIDGRGANGAKILAGIDVDIPIAKADIVEGAKIDAACRTTRERVREATKAALAAGADGIVISRKYSEMQLDHLSGIGDALRA